MEFQQYFDPFGRALAEQGAMLQNTSKAISNATNLYKLGMVQEQYKEMVDDLNESRASFATHGGADPGLPKTQSDGANTDPNTALTSKDTFKLYQQNNQLAQRYKWNPERQKFYQGQADKFLTDTISLQEKEYKDKDKFMDDFANAATMAARSPEDQGVALAVLQHRLPPGMSLGQVLQGAGMKIGPNGQVAWNPQAWEKIARDSKTFMEESRLKQQAFADQVRLAQAKREDDRLTLYMKRQERLDAKDREGAEAKAREEKFGKLPVGKRWRDPDDPSKGMEKIPEYSDPKVVDKAQGELDKDESYKNYDRYQQATGAVRAIEGKLEQPGGYQNVTPGDIQRLRSHYVNIINDFKSRGIGKYNEVEFNKLNGVLQSLDKWVSTIGRGTPAAAERPAKDAMAVINDEFATRTQNLVKSELKLGKNVEKRGGDPENLRFKGDVQWLTSRGYAVVKPDTDDATKKWIFFKDDKDHPMEFYEGAF